MLLQILEDGRLTDSNGRTIDFKNTVIIMTSNAGAKNLIENHTIGFGNRDDKTKDYEKNKDQIMSELKKIFRPEFLNRVDEIILFNKLSKDDINKITRLMLNEFKKRASKKNIEIEFSENLVEYISKIGFDDNYGARPLRRTIQSKIEDKFAEELLSGNIKENDNILVDVQDDKIIINKKK